jgi:hypothetical protein
VYGIAAVIAYQNPLPRISAALAAAALATVNSTLVSAALYAGIVVVTAGETGRGVAGAPAAAITAIGLGSALVNRAAEADLVTLGRIGIWVGTLAVFVTAGLGVAKRLDGVQCAVITASVFGTLFFSTTAAAAIVLVAAPVWGGMRRWVRACGGGTATTSDRLAVAC